ncbi:hypothetical protein [Conexibacter arvalis]|uniref:Secreted protein n=1 Tax=Conexibacter arvalis TaxID=912552 RepID=A0A840IBQ1_9ACTN|nr:hypothetical protein [Conexibacter arvalis]MBB4662319.1 hypothetical protein [Conexibacter arvalis]
MARRRIRTLLVTLAAAALGAGAGATSAGAAPATLVDPLEGQPLVADIGEMTASVRADGVLEVRTQLVARPPAGWGGCIPLASGVCMLADMRVTWYLDSRAGGSSDEHGADAKIAAIPAWDRTSWLLDGWSDADARWLRSANVPAAATDAGGARWALPLAWLGIRPGAVGSVRLRAVSRIVPLDPLGQPQPPVRDETDWLVVPLAADPSAPAADRPVPAAPTAGSPDAVPTGEAAPRAPTAARRACTRAGARVRRLDRRIRRAARAARARRPAARRRAARRELRRLRMQRNAALADKRRACAKASQPPSR